MDIEDYKKTSFVANLTDKDVKELINKCGYRLDYRVVDESDGMRQTIERVYDSRNRKVRVEVCAINRMQEGIYNKVSSMSGLFPVFESNKYCSTVIVISDYAMYDMLQTMLDKKSNVDMQTTFAKYMYDKFGERYKTNYNKYITRIVNKANKENKDNLEK